jgi:hypothetical protein
VPLSAIANWLDHDFRRWLGAFTGGDGVIHAAGTYGPDAEVFATGVALLVERTDPAGHVIAASGVNPTVREIGEAAAAPGAGVPPEDPEVTRARLGTDLGDALMMGQQAFAEKRPLIVRPGRRRGPAITGDSGGRPP